MLKNKKGLPKNREAENTYTGNYNDFKQFYQEQMLPHMKNGCVGSECPEWTLHGCRFNWLLLGQLNHLKRQEEAKNHD